MVELDRLASEREVRKRDIVTLFGQLGSERLNSGRVSSVEIASEHDVHAFFRFTAYPDVVIHVQAYPGMSTAEKTTVIVRQMSYERLIEIRASAAVNGGPSIGNEHEAVTQRLSEQIEIPNEFFHSRLTAFL